MKWRYYRRGKCIFREKDEGSDGSYIYDNGLWCHWGVRDNALGIDSGYKEITEAEAFLEMI